MPEKRPIAVVIVVHQQRVLVGKRASNAATAKGFHEFPGGKIETGESAPAAAVRECLEETGLRISIEQQLDRTFTDEGHFEIIFFLGSLLEWSVLYDRFLEVSAATRPETTLFPK